MSVYQYIFIALTIVIATGGFAEVSGDSNSRWSIGRTLIALAVPLLWIAFIVYVPYESFRMPGSTFKGEFWRLVGINIAVTFMGLFLFVVLPVIVVISNLLWIAGVMTGEIGNYFRGLFRK